MNNGPASDRSLSDVSLSTLAVVAGRPSREPGAPLTVGMSFSSTYVADGDIGYGRHGNVTWAAFEEALGALEGGTAVAFASGIAAVAAALEDVATGGVVIAALGSYSGTLTLLDRWRASGRLRDVRLVDIADTAAVIDALPGASLVWLESPTNPLLAIADIPTITAAARAAGVRCAVDATFATPLLLRGLDQGADVVVHSGTKYLAGHSDALIGALVSRDPDTVARAVAHRTAYGAIPGTAEAWLALRGMRTLHLRLERSQHNAMVLAERLAAHRAVSRVRYPGLAQDPGHARAAQLLRGFGSIVAIEMHGGVAASDALVAGCALWTHATSLGGVESTLERRRRWASESAAVPESLLRLSVGIEDVDDLWADLVQALDAI